MQRMDLEEVAQQAKLLLKKDPLKQPPDAMFLGLGTVGWHTLNGKVIYFPTIEIPWCQH
jgi:hypothetical protein